MNQLVEGVLPVGTRFPPHDRTGGIVHTSTGAADRLTVRFHVTLREEGKREGGGREEGDGGEENDRILKTWHCYMFLIAIKQACKQSCCAESS